MAQFDNISASFDGTTTSFALTISGSPVALPAKRDIDIKVGGVEHYEGTDFTIAGSTITFSVAPYPGDLFAGEYLDPANSDYALAADLAAKANQTDVDANTSAIALTATQADLDALTDTVNNLPTGGGTGPIDDRVIGGVTPAAATFTDVSVEGLIAGGDITLNDNSPTITLNDQDGTNYKGTLSQAAGSLVFTTRYDQSHGSIDFRSFDGTHNRLRFRVATDGDFNFYNSNGTTKMKWDAPNARLGIGTNSPSEVLHVEGNAKITNVATVDGGVKIGGTSAENLLEEYEEGTHDPVLTPTQGGTITLHSQVKTLNYVKVGKKVTVTGMITASGLSSPAGYFTISLPFTIGSWGGTYGGRTTGSIWVNPASGVNANDFILYGIQGESTVRVYTGGANSIQQNAAQSLTTNCDILINFSYLSE